MTLISDADLERRPWLLDNADDLTRLLHVQRGVLSMRQALRHLSRGAVRHRLDAGHWRQVHRGVLIAHNGPVAEEQTPWVAVLAAGDGEPALLGGRSALTALGLKGFESDRIHVLLPAGRREGNPPRGVVVHRTRRLPPQDVRPTGRPPCTTAERSIVDAASWARTDREARTVIAMAFQQRLVGLDGIRDVLARMPRAGRRKLTWTTAADAAGGAESLAELDITRLIIEAGLPRPTRQQVRVDATGRRRYLDLYFAEWGVHVEVDGSHHLDPHHAWLDMDRQNQLWIEGDRVLRFPAWLVRDEPHTVVAAVKAALLAAGWRPAIRDLGEKW